MADETQGVGAAGGGTRGVETPAAARPEKILIVDDATFMRFTIKKYLVKNGFATIEEASDVPSAVEAYKNFRPDLVTMDITMPVISGIEGLAQILAFDPKARVVMVSAAGQKDMVMAALSKGAKHFIVKPFQEQGLIAIIEKVLKS